MKRVAFVGDSHFHDQSRFLECVAIHDWIADDIAARNVDALVHTGDVFDRRSTADERNAVAAWLAKCASACPVLVIRGNHDVVNDLSIYSRIRPDSGGHEIVVEEFAGVHVIAGVAIAAVAWPRKAELLARMPDAGHEQTEQVAGAALEDLFRGLGLQLDAESAPVAEFPRLPRVLAMHAMVRGSRTSIGQPLVGCDLEVGLESFSLAGADFTALGHIHAPQQWDVGAPIVYTGSPRRTSFGEVEAKGYVIATFGDDGGLVSWERVATPCRAMLLLEATHEPGSGLAWKDESFATAFGADRAYVVGAEIRLRYRVASVHRDAARASAAALEADLMSAGAFSVKVEEEVLAETRARTPEVTKAASTFDKMRVLWAARGFAPAKAKAERLRSKLVAVGG